MRPLSRVYLITLLLAGCGSVDTRYYAFPGIQDEDMALVGQVKGVIVVGPITIDEDLDRPQLMIRRSDTRMEIKENDLWANTMEQEIQKLTIAALSKLLANSKLVPFPWTGSEAAAYRVSMEILEMSAMPGNEAVLTVSWSIYNEGTRKLEKLPAANYRAPVSANADLDEIVKIYQGLLLRASRDLAQRLFQMAVKKRKRPVT
jgi:uncharacterized lipoprotein YmbA